MDQRRTVPAFVNGMFGKKREQRRSQRCSRIVTELYWHYRLSPGRKPYRKSRFADRCREEEAADRLGIVVRIINRSIVAMLGPARGTAVRPVMVAERGPVVMAVLGPGVRSAVPVMIAALGPVTPVILGRAVVSAPAPSGIAPIAVSARPGAARHQNKYRAHRNNPLY